MILRLTAIAVILMLAACGEHGDLRADGERGRAMRIVSLDYCADQYVLRLVEPDRILAVSYEATAEYSYMRAAARGLPTVRPRAEDALALEPDLIVRSYGGGPGADALFERAGIPVLNVGYAGTLDGVETVLRHMADGLDANAEGQALVTEMRARLARLARGDRGRALYLTPTGVTTGPGSLVHEMLLAAGYTNFVERPGWHPIPLERLPFDQPDHIAAAFFDTGHPHLNAWSAMRHPIARAQLAEQPTTYLQGAWTSCGSWFLLDAIEALAHASGQSVALQ